MAKFHYPNMTPQHVKAARALLGMTADELAHLLDVSVATLRNFERGAETTDKSREMIFVGLTEMGVVMQAGSKIGVSITEPDKWSFNFKKVTCPNCSQTLPPIRVPKNSRQFLWGGWTCEKCGCEISKMGKVLQKT
ncbi:helix-turn-helix domain-containing protein [Roseobacter sinensis]|uniref:Helix-turn-helix domain-containing protein n=1 Tax=Roseobacter sinensis TaxID=2931391 RepID=A0ABT3BL33_9RHOB|nr:helix-turn-helix domain-containing protein [Roseobacter sp. WL0113]MCV3274278.1 helix-turn-helix domain-containing protein [Roseobacter sp. WL0113]